jgi:hypothetical protein
MNSKPEVRDIAREIPVDNRKSYTLNSLLNEIKKLMKILSQRKH